MDQLDREWVLKGHIPLSHAGDMIGLSHPEFKTWLDVVGVTSEQAELNASVFELYRIELVRRLLDLDYTTQQIREMSLQVQRGIVGSLQTRLPDPVDWSVLFDAAEQLDRQACFDVLAKVRAELGSLQFATEYSSALMQEVGKRWWHGHAAVFQEHFITTALRTYLSAIMLEQVPHQRPALRTIVTTPHGEFHEIGAMLASIAAHEAGHETVFLGSQLPVAEIMQAVDTFGAHIVCLASSFLEVKRLRAQVVQLREVLPSHVVICLGGRQFDQRQFSSLNGTLVYDNLPSFDADMRAFSRVVQQWLPK